MHRLLLFISITFLLLSCSQEKIAFISDPHIMDVEGHPELVKSMAEEVRSTRLFNENIFALRAALDDVAKRKIKLVVIPGDMTDDGQLLNQEAARALLQQYEERYGMMFFMTPGNHDPKVPFGRRLSESSFLNADGNTHEINSDMLPELWSAGHKEQIECYASFGYFPREEYLYWETPFSDWSADSYSYETALAASAAEFREFTICDSTRFIDTSYLVEPVEGIWILSLDSGVYPPDGKGGYQNSGSGYNNTLQYKPYLIPWVRKVADEAKARGKQLITFSHFPLLDFNNGATEYLSRSWGKDKFDIGRIPSSEVTDAMIEAGVSLHFAGHMHVNNTVSKTTGGKTLTNIQVPSLAAGVPAYKIMKLKKGRYSIKDIVIADVPGFDALFELYQKEWERELAQSGQPDWKHEVIETSSYAALCDWQMRELTRLRFCKRDVPAILQNEFVPYTGAELIQRIDSTARIEKGMERWTGYDIILDIYRFHYSGQLAWSLVSRRQIRQYEKLFDAARRSDEDSEFLSQLRDLDLIFHRFMDQ